MKYILILITLFLFSCHNTPIEVENPAKVTTQEILNIANTDTISYKRVYLDNTMYLVSNGEVKYKLLNSTGIANTLLIASLIFFILGLLLGLNFD